jgi:hypothetical protein
MRRHPILADEAVAPIAQTLLHVLMAQTLLLQMQTLLVLQVVMAQTSSLQMQTLLVLQDVMAQSLLLPVQTSQVMVAQTLVMQVTCRMVMLMRRSLSHRWVTLLSFSVTPERPRRILMIQSCYPGATRYTQEMHGQCDDVQLKCCLTGTRDIMETVVGG